MSTKNLTEIADTVLYNSFGLTETEQGFIAEVLADNIEACCIAAKGRDDPESYITRNVRLARNF